MLLLLNRSKYNLIILNQEHEWYYPSSLLAILSPNENNFDVWGYTSTSMYRIE